MLHSTLDYFQSGFHIYLTLSLGKDQLLVELKNDQETCVFSLNITKKFFQTDEKHSQLLQNCQKLYQSFIKFLDKITKNGTIILQVPMGVEQVRIFIKTQRVERTQDKVLQKFKRQQQFNQNTCQQLEKIKSQLKVANQNIENLQQSLRFLEKENFRRKYRLNQSFQIKQNQQVTQVTRIGQIYATFFLDCKILPAVSKQIFFRLKKIWRYQISIGIVPERVGIIHSIAQEGVFAYRLSHWSLVEDGNLISTQNGKSYEFGDQLIAMQVNRKQGYISWKFQNHQIAKIRILNKYEDETFLFFFYFMNCGNTIKIYEKIPILVNQMI